jgi:phage terminase large subunit-like protein
MTKRAMTTTSSATERVTQYARRVVAEEVVAGPHVRNACWRHLDDLEKAPARGFTFSEEKADRAFRFFERKLKLSEGQFEGKPLVLHESQAFIIGSIFGWVRADGTRRFRRAYIEQGKGNGKSPLAGGIGLYGLMADQEAGAEIYSAGATKDQAGILFRDAVKMVDKSPELDARVKQSGGPGRVYNLANLKNASFFRPISRDAKKTGSGPRPHFALADEVHEHPDRGVLEILERGFKFRRQPLLFMITNSGSDRNSICWEEHEHAIKVAAGNREAKDGDATYVGEPLDDTTFSYVCGLDPGDDPLEDSSCWPKANPLLGVTITYEYLAGVVAQARAMPGKLNGILRLHFCVWTDADIAWMTRPILESSLADFDPVEEHQGERVFEGLDLSQNRDITAKACVTITGSKDVEVEIDGKKQIVEKPTYDAWVEAWTPGDTLAAREFSDKQPYGLWVSEGFLNAPKGSSIRFDHVAQALADDTRDFEVVAVAYDRYAFRRFEEDCNTLGLNLEFAEHPQGGTKKGKPSEAMKEAAYQADREAEGLWMPGSLRELEDAFLEGRIRLRRNPVVISAIMSAVTDEDRWGNKWLSKERATNKIDCAVALCMAIGAAMAFNTGSSRSVYEERGLLVFG